MIEPLPHLSSLLKRCQIIIPAFVAFSLSIGLLAAAEGRADRTAKPGQPRLRTLRFNRDIRPILSDKCFQCHGPDAHQRKGKLRLDLQAGATAPAGSGNRAIIPGNAEESDLVDRITSPDAELRMPPAKTGKPLSEDQIRRLKTWIAEGAEYEAHWAFIPPVRPEIPRVEHQGWVRNPIDAFVLARLKKAGLSPSPEADRTTLIRRLNLDLLGLPPAIKDVDAFLADGRSDSYETLVARLLDSPHFGERWEGSGSTRRAMPIPTATRRTSRAPSISTATG